MWRIWAVLRTLASALRVQCFELGKRPQDAERSTTTCRLHADAIEGAVARVGRAHN